MKSSDTLVEDDNGLDDSFDYGAKPIAKPLTPALKVIYGFGDFSCSASSAIFAFYLLPFLFEVAGVHPFTVAAILLFSRAWDGITDPIVGRLSDITKTRWGRRRPWLVVGSIPLAISYFFFWLVFPGFGQFLDFCYYLFWLIMYNTFYTFISVPHLSLIPEMTDSDKERSELTSYKISTLVFAALIGTTVHGIILEIIPNARTAYFISALIFAIVFIPPPIITGVVCKETAGLARKNQQKQPSFIEGIKSAVKNKPFMLLCASFLGAYMATQFLVANFYLYVQYVLDSENHVVFLIILLQLTIGIATLCWQRATLGMGKKPVFYMGSFCCIICTLWLIFVRSVFWLYPGCLLLGIGIGAIFLVPFAMIPEIIDLDEQKAGCRREGIYYGMFIFLQKMATSVGLAVGSILLGIAGLDTSAPNDDAPLSVIFTLRLMVGIIPTILYAFSILPMILYPYGSNGPRRLRKDPTVELDDVSDYKPPEVILEGKVNE